MREIKTRTVRAAVCAALLCGGAGAAVADDITTTISGYGTLGGTFTTGDSQVAFHHDPTEFTGATSQFDVALESRLGLQAVVDFGSGFSATAQELIRQRGQDQFSLGTEWLYGQYAPNSDWKLRVGRVVLPTFLLSDSRNVGYAAPWFRAPNEIYGSQQIQSLDGEQVVWTHTLGPVEFGLQGSFGNTTTNSFVPPTAGQPASVQAITIKNMYNFSASLQFENFLVRVAQTNLNIPTSLPLPTGKVPFELQDKFTSVGLQYDNGHAIVLSEWARVKDSRAPVINEIVGDASYWYAAGGWRFGKFTPMVIYGGYQPRASLSTPVAANFRTWSASLRYDVVRNIALKAQYSRPQSDNQVYWVTPSATSQRVNVISFGADFVF